MNCNVLELQLDEFRQHIEKDGALERRFQKIIVEPTSIEETIEILNNIKINMRNIIMLSLLTRPIKSCVILTDRYMNDRFLPDKAIDALDKQVQEFILQTLMFLKILQI